MFLVCLAVVWPHLSQAASNTAAKETATGQQPRIGLVLGGGGARGIAHVGVLKVLEELRIPVDVVVGTSMGSIVGGLYAAGMTPEEIEREMLAMDWVDVFQDAPRREDRSFRRKRDDDLYSFKAKLGVGEGRIKLPLAYIHGQKLQLALNRLTLPVAGVKDFDRMPIPYRAIAADIETGKEVVLAKGNIASAIRASMAVPAVFDPVEIDGRLLVDGGIANNVPVSVARDMGVDVLIVVDVGSGLFSREDISTGLDVTVQLTNFLFTLNTEQQLQTLGKRDVLMRPALGDIGGGDFKRASEAISIGEQAARNATDGLRRYALSSKDYASHVAHRKGRQPRAPVIDFVRIDNQSSVGDDVIASRIRARIGEPFDVTQLEEDIAQVYGLEIFESVRYELVQQDGQSGLVVHAKEKSWGPGYLQFGLATSNDLEGDTTARFGVIYTLSEINALNGEWRTGIQLGDEPGIFTELHQPLDPLSRYFVSGKIAYINNIFNTFDSEGNNLARYGVRTVGIELGIGREFGTWGEGRLGYRRRSGTADIKVGPPAPDIDVEDGNVFVRLSDDKLDDPYFPHNGHYGKLEYLVSRDRFGANTDYEQWLFSYTQAVSWGDNTLIGSVSGGSTVDDNAPLEGLFELGGFLRLSGLQQDELSGQSSGLLSLIYMHRLVNVQFFKGYAGASLETGNVWQRSEDVSFDNTITAGSLFVGFNTPIGPLYLGYGRTDTQRDSLYIYLGPRISF